MAWRVETTRSYDVNHPDVWIVDERGDGSRKRHLVEAFLATMDDMLRIAAALNATEGMTLEALESPAFRDFLKQHGWVPMEE